jgi:hypothetical protein
MVWMVMAPIPVILLLVLFGMRVFVRVPVVFLQVPSPVVILVVIPVVIVLMVAIVDADLNAGLLRCRGGHK